MKKIEGDAAGVAAAMLVQAEMTLRATTGDGRRELRTAFGDPRGIVGGAYEHYLALVVSGDATGKHG